MAFFYEGSVDIFVAANGEPVKPDLASIQVVTVFTHSNLYHSQIAMMK